ncbi:glycosyltransferase [Nocardioides sp. P5_C9_2]
MTALVVALAGTDHHPFERMVQWVDTEAACHADVRFVVQHGATRPPRVAEGYDFLTHDRLVALLAEASLVVCHGGPGTIMDAREAGHVPLCIPRDPLLGEHVDGHQQRFASLAGGSGVVRVVSTAAVFHEELESALLPATVLRAVGSTTQDRDAARALAAAELDSLINRRPSRHARLFRAAG